MRPLFVSLFAKLALTLVALGVALSVALTSVLERSHKAFHLELHQQIFLSLAAQLLVEAATASGEPDTGRVLGRVRQLNITSPGLAAYVVSSNGEILASSRSANDLRRRVVAIQPIQEFIKGPSRLPLTGDDPLSDRERTIFSAAPLGSRGEFLYVVLDSGSNGRKTQLFPAGRSHSERDALWLMVGNVVGGLLAALALTWFITKPIARLRLAMDSFDKSGFEGAWREVNEPRLLRDEIDRLGEIFSVMAARITAHIESLRRADQDRRELFADISHDLRTPLTAVRGYIDRLATRRDLTDSDRASYFGIVRRKADELDRLIGQILEIAKLESPQIQPCVTDFRLDELVEGVIGELRPRIEEKQMQVSTSLSPLRVRADEHLIRRAIANLLDNAVRESPPGETIEVSVAEGGHVSCEISIADRGPGISSGEIDDVFRRFYRGPGRDGGAAQGVGLGLAIVKRIAELHGGSVAAENRPGGGVIFRLLLLGKTDQTQIRPT